MTDAKIDIMPTGYIPTLEEAISKLDRKLDWIHLDIAGKVEKIHLSFAISLTKEILDNKDRQVPLTEPLLGPLIVSLPLVKSKKLEQVFEDGTNLAEYAKEVVAAVMREFISALKQRGYSKVEDFLDVDRPAED